MCVGGGLCSASTAVGRARNLSDGNALNSSALRLELILFTVCCVCRDNYSQWRRLHLFDAVPCREVGVILFRIVRQRRCWLLIVGRFQWRHHLLLYWSLLLSLCVNALVHFTEIQCLHSSYAVELSFRRSFQRHTVVCCVDALLWHLTARIVLRFFTDGRSGRCRFCCFCCCFRAFCDSLSCVKSILE